MTVDYTINNLPAELVIGRRTETGVFDVRIDCAPWLALWPELVLIIWVTPPGGGEQYPATTHMEGDVLVWDVNIVDTAVEGKGTMEVMGLAEGLKKLSTITTTQVLHTTTVSESEIPDSAQGWVDQVLSETAHNVNEAKNSATSAAGYATSAAQSAEAAGASESVAAQSAQASEASAQRAAQSAEDAAQAAEEAADQTATEILSTIDGVLSQRDRVWNLLDDSNFLDPINQRGASSYTNNGHTIDRWRDTTNCTTLITAEGLTLQNNSTSSNAYWRQRLPASVLTSGKTYTMALNIDGVVYCGHAVVNSTAQVTFYGASGLYLSCTGLTSSTYWTIQIALSAGKTFAGVRWAALYEGEYTADNLPAYVPKGYAAELAECQRYFYRANAMASAFYGGLVMATGVVRTNYIVPVPMRIKPTVTVGDVSACSIYSNGTGKIPTAIAVNGWQEGSVSIVLENTVTGLSGGHVSMQNFSTTIDLSAEL